MADELMKAIEDVGKDIAKPFEEIGKIEKVLTTVMKEETPLRAGVIQFSDLCKVVIDDGANDVADKGLNIAADEETLADANTAFQYFKDTLLPLFEQAFGEIETDVEDPAPAEPAA